MQDTETMEGMFAISNGDLGQLGANDAVERFRELLWAEAHAIGLAKNLINVPSAITTADGGVDAEARSVLASQETGLFRTGLTRYQIKTGGFSPASERDRRELLFSETTGEIKPRIKSCLDSNGTLVILAFGWDGPERRDEASTQPFVAELVKKDPKYKDAKVEVWGQNIIRSYLQPYVSLCLRITGRDSARFESHRSWSQHEEMRKALELGPAQAKFAEDLRGQLREEGTPVHVRVWGDPGIGKTRLTLEAMSSDDLKPLVVYCDSPSKFEDSDLMNLMLRDDSVLAAIVVVDECDPASRASIWDRLQYKSPRIKLVTIYNEADLSSGRTTYMSPEALQQADVEKIIQGYGIPDHQAGRWAEFCSGSPRVAHMIGDNLKRYPDDVLRTPDTVEVWERYLAGTDDPQLPIVAQRRTVLRHIALFKKFGYGKPVANEAEVISQLVKEADSSITWAKFQEIVRDLRSRRVLQGETTLYITPKLLHIWLWVDWWENYGEHFDIDAFLGRLPPALVEWFSEMFKYAAESATATKIVSKLLGPGGPLRDSDFLRTKLGAGFFLALTEASPADALACLNATLGTWELPALKAFTEGRRQVVWSLERIAVWRAHFIGAAKLLLNLAEGENESWANNATGVFTDLFSPGTGRVAPTEAPPLERLPILREALESNSQERRVIALIALGKALSTGPFSRGVGPEHQGLKKEPDLWRPKTYGELFDAYRGPWTLLSDRLADLSGADRNTAVDIILDSAGGLASIENLGDMVLATVKDLVQRHSVDTKKVLGTVLRVLRFEGSEFPEEVRAKWIALRDELTGTGFHALLRRYVGTDFREDAIDEQGAHSDPKLSQIQALATQAIGDMKLLEPELDWLVTSEAVDGFRFGYELGKRDESSALLGTLLENQRKVGEHGNLFFLGGYFRALAERDETLWEGQISQLADDEKTASWTVELTWRSAKLTTKLARRIVDLASKGVITPAHFQTFIYGGVIRQLPSDIFAEWIRFLLGVGDRDAMLVALDLCHMYRYGNKRELPVDLVLDVLLHELWFEESHVSRGLQQQDYEWSELAQQVVNSNPEVGLRLAERIIDSFGRDGTIFERSDRINALLTTIATRWPDKVWEMVARHLMPDDDRSFHLRHWLWSASLLADGRGGALAVFPRRKIWDWVEEDIEERAWYLAYSVPKDLGEAGSLVREILVKYGNRDDVRRNLHANYSSEGWTGPASRHYAKRRSELQALREEEADPRVFQWLDERIEQLTQDIEKAKVDEERRGY